MYPQAAVRACLPAHLSSGRVQQHGRHFVHGASHAVLRVSAAEAGAPYASASAHPRRRRAIHRPAASWPRQERRCAEVARGHAADALLPCDAQCQQRAQAADAADVDPAVDAPQVERWSVEQRRLAAVAELERKLGLRPRQRQRQRPSDGAPPSAQPWWQRRTTVQRVLALCAALLLALAVLIGFQ